MDLRDAITDFKGLKHTNAQQLSCSPSAYVRMAMDMVGRSQHITVLGHTHEDVWHCDSVS